MDPYDEQRLREEVLYLHSLWHRGPPRQQHQPPLSNPSLHRHSNPPQFKKENPKSRKMSKKKRGQEYQKRDQKHQRNTPDSGKEWPITPFSTTSPVAPSGWPTVSSGNNSLTPLPSPEEQARFAANLAQTKALKSTKQFLFSSNSSDDDDDDENEFMDEDDYDDDDGCDEYRFFYKLFMEDGELKEYYLKNYHNGEFSCLVCGGIGKKNAWKKYKDCVALIQHSISIAKTKRKRAHRAYGQAICRILGWEIDKLPKIISDLNEKLKETSNKSRAVEGEAQGHNAGDTKDTSSILVSNEASMGINNGPELQKQVSTDTENFPINNEARQEELQKQESVDAGNMPNNGESVISEQVLTTVEIPESTEDLSSTVKTLDDVEPEQRDKTEPSQELSAFEGEEKDAAAAAALPSQCKLISQAD